MNATTILAAGAAVLAADLALALIVGAYLTAGHGPDIDRTRR